MNNDRLDTLITAFMDQNITKTEMRELDAILAESSEAALRFAQLTTLDSLLEDHFGEQKALNQTEDALLKLIQQSPAPAPTPIPKPAQKRSLSIGLFKTAIAAGLIIGIGFWFLRDTPTATPQPTPPVENKTPAPMAYIQQFSGDVVIQRARQRIPATQQMILESGDRLISQTDASVEIRYASEPTSLTLAHVTQATLLKRWGQNHPTPSGRSSMRRRPATCRQTHDPNHRARPRHRRWHPFLPQHSANRHPSHRGRR